MESQHKSRTSTVDDLFNTVADCIVESSGWHLQEKPHGWLLVECVAHRVNQSFEIRRTLSNLELWRTETTNSGPKRLDIVPVDSIGTIADICDFLEKADPRLATVLAYARLKEASS